MIDIVGEEANALATEIYGTLCGVAFILAPLAPDEHARNAEGEQARNAVIRCIRKLEIILAIPEGERLQS